MRQKIAIFACLIVATAVLMPLESPAQFGGGMPGGGMRGSRNRPDAPAKDQRPPLQDNSPEHVEDRLGMLEEDLRLSVDQRAAWQSYADKVMALAVDAARERERGPLGGASMSSVQQLDRAVDVARNRMTALEEIALAAKSLYGVLSAQQKTVADPRMATIVSAITDARPAPERTGRPRPAP
jgi:hypothetical protein